MQYSPKLKTAMEAIKAILKKHDIAGAIVIHTPGHSEYLNHINTSYSCARAEGDTIRIKAAAKDFGGDAKKRDQSIADTVNMLTMFAETQGRNSIGLFNVMDQVEAAIGKHDSTDTGHSSHTEQNN